MEWLVTAEPLRQRLRQVLPGEVQIALREVVPDFVHEVIPPGCSVAALGEASGEPDSVRDRHRIGAFNQDPVHDAGTEDGGGHLMRNIFRLDQVRAFQSEAICGFLTAEDVPVLRAITAFAGAFLRPQPRSIHEGSQGFGVEGFGQVHGKVIRHDPQARGRHSPCKTP